MGGEEERTVDLPELIAQTQKDTAEPLPQGVSLLPRYLGLDDELSTPDDGSPSIDTSGPIYYCSPASSGDPIICGFWKAS